LFLSSSRRRPRALCLSVQACIPFTHSHTHTPFRPFRTHLHTESKSFQIYPQLKAHPRGCTSVSCVCYLILVISSQCLKKHFPCPHVSCPAPSVEPALAWYVADQEMFKASWEPSQTNPTYYHFHIDFNVLIIPLLPSVKL